MWGLFRQDIAEYVLDGKIWFDPKTGKPLALCPWLRKTPEQNTYSCDIYFDRPDDCKYYPVSIEQMVKDECEMLEATDRQDPKKAQRQLDVLMSDSRPGLS